jgi:asparagine synthase (glutamine-hydrolysing)
VSFESDLARERDVVERMTATMARRGPDESGIWVDRHVALGHRRLAVIDVEGGRQPMRTRDVALTYSGEVYNFQELRREFEARGRRFMTRSDTEVVLHGYLEWGEGVADHLNGMYALALWDGREQKLVLLRDRLGVKPLYYHRTRDGVLFASEPKGILANPRYPRAVDTRCLRELVGFTKAPGWCLWKDMYELEPGTLACVTRQGLAIRRYWRLETREHTQSEESTVDEVRGLLTDIVSRQLIADVPQCVLLSGGLDSSAITALAAAELAPTGQRVRSYSVDFSDHERSFAPDELRDRPDSIFVPDAVAHLGLDHRSVVLDSRRLLDPELRRCVVTARDMPIGLGDIDASMYLLFQAIRAESTVALSGEFADEVFGGYPWFFHPQARDADTFPWLAFQNAYVADRTAPLRPELRAELAIDAYIADEYASAVAAVDHVAGAAPIERRMRTSRHLHLTRLGQALLDRKDRLSMAVGLEVRVPFADHRLVSYVYNAPWAVLAAAGREKALLRRAVAPLLPRSILDRVKSAYPSTHAPEYAVALREQARQLLSERGSRVFDVFDPSWLRATLDRPPETTVGATRTGLERILDFHCWLESYGPSLLL